MKKRLKDYYSNTNSDSACRLEKGRTIIQIKIETAVVFSKRGGHLQLVKILKDYYSNTNSDSACSFEKGRTSAVEKDIEGILFKYE